MRFQFTMKQDNTIVATGFASVTMVYEFQKTFIETIGYHDRGRSTLEGRFVTLDSLLNRKVGEYDKWVVNSVDEKRYLFEVERIA